MSDRVLHLNAFLMSTGHHEASWRLPESDPRANTDIEHYKALARTAERGTFDSLFLADSPALWGGVAQRPSGVIEPLTLLTVLSTVTEHIGLIATASTSYNSPYNLARRFASLDHVSGGRAGWNIVTTAGGAAARNFGLDDVPEHAERYARAAEFTDVALKLWDSWDPDVLVGDKELGVWGDDRKVHPARHRGRFYAVEGALNIPRSPQGAPLIVQAGSSEDGKDFAAHYAEAVFTAQQTLADAKSFYADLKARTAAAGRDPDGIKILPGLVPVIGSTVAEARARDAELEELITYEHGRGRLAELLHVPLERLGLDDRLPDDLPPPARVNGAQSRYELVVSLARRDRLTVRELIGRLGGGRGHRTFAGTPEQVADQIEAWFGDGAADGFNIMPPVLPSGLDLFVDEVVPILRRRGLFRDAYVPGQTLRGRYGLAPTPPGSSAGRTSATRTPRESVKESAMTVVTASADPVHPGTVPAAPAAAPTAPADLIAAAGLEVTKVTARIGARVAGVDLTRDLAPTVVAAIRAALNEHKALVFDATGLDDEGQQRFARHFGELTTAHPTVPALAGAPNVLPVDSERGGRANHWHTDVTFVVSPPQASTLRSVVLPPYGGETLIANSATAYRDLPEPLRAFADTLWAVHSNVHDYAVPDRELDTDYEERRRIFTSIEYETAHPVVRVHPLTGERGLFIGGFAQRIVGLSNGESRKILEILQAYVTRPENVLRWRWSPNELVLFDNRITQHYAIDNYDDLPRRLHRVTVAGDIPVGVHGRSSYSIEGDASHYTSVAEVAEVAEFAAVVTQAAAAERQPA
jgi:FMN-dependent oxidoreductase (nitrilotriacetate monooxygenase family)